MTIEKIRKYCMKKKGAVEDFPFDFQTLTVKVGNKMFILMDINSSPPAMNLKCDPFLAAGLREKYKSVTPGYHMNKTHWNTVTDDGSIPEKEILSMIDHSYDLVFKSLKKSERDRIDSL